MSRAPLGEVSWERMIRALEKVRERLQRATAALEKAGVPYAVIGGNAVAAWVSRVDESSVRNTQDVDLMIRRTDWGAAATTLSEAGFIHRQVAGIDVFLDGRNAKARDTLHVIFAGERVRADDLLPAPEVDDSEQTQDFRLISLNALVRMKLTSFRNKDRMHLRDLLDVGLIDRTWLNRLPAPLAERLQEVVDDPNG